jgi:hypothetical protein
MTWLRLQARGALVVLAAWAGLAVAQAPPSPQPVSSSGAQPTVLTLEGQQTPSRPPAKSGTERIVTVNENGKSIRCRLVQTWKLADGSTAHQLQAIESGEFITILDDPSVTAPAGSRGLPKRIFHWGLKNRTPPLGTPTPPIPPELLVDSGVVLTREVNRPKQLGETAVVLTRENSRPTPKADPVIAAAQESDRPRGEHVASTSPYRVGDASVTVISTPSPYRLGETGTNVAGATKATSPYSVGGTIPDPSVVGGSKGPSSCDPSRPGPVVTQPMANDAPTLREKIQAWMASRSVKELTPRETKTAVSEKTQELAITTPPSSAQPARPEVVASVTKDEMARGWSKPASTVAQPGREFPATSEMKPAETRPAETRPAETRPAETRSAEARSAVPMPQKGVVVEESTPTSSDGLPPGAQSVLAARCGLDGPIAFIPVQTPVVPQPWRPPLPPDPKTPEAPQLNAFVNAFTPPAVPRGSGGPQEYPQMVMPNRPIPGPYGPMPYGPMPPYAMPQGMNPYMMPPYAMNPYMAPQGMPYGYPMAQPGYPMMPMAQQAMQAMPWGSRYYQGPLPPNPAGAPVAAMMPVAVPPPAGYAAAPVVPAAVPPMPAAPQQANVPIAQLMDMLRDAESPAQREMAANYLGTCDWRANPQIASALVYAAGQDPAPTVRAGCVLTLMRMSCTNESVINLLQALRTDGDPRVREAVDQAMLRLGHAN